MNFFLGQVMKASRGQADPAAVTKLLKEIVEKLVIRLRNVEKFFQHGATKTFVLRRIDVDIQEGDFVSIMGPSGAGKSTLLHLIGMHDTSWTGEYHFLDYPVHAMKKKDRDEIYKKYFGFVFQSYHLLDSLTVYENLEIPLSYRNVRKSERDAAVCDVLDRFQMVGKKDLFPESALGRAAATGGRRARDHRQSESDSGRRAHGQPPLQPSQGDYGGVPEAQRIRHHHHPGDAFGVECFLRETGDPDRRRLD